MQIDADELLQKAMADAIRDGIKARLLQSYNNPFDKIIEQAVASQAASFHQLVLIAVQSIIGDAGFHEELKRQTRESVAKLMVKRFGGELERQVNMLKSDPTIRNRITAALDEIVKSKVES